MRVLFVSLTDDIGTDRLVGDMGRAGAACAVIGPAGCLASLPRCVTRSFAVPSGLLASFTLGRVLRRAVAEWRPDRLIPLDDLAATLLRGFAGKPRPPAAIQALLQASFGDSRGFAAACGRVALMEAAQACGVRMPPFVAANGRIGGDRPAPLPAMVKRDQSSGSGGVVRVDERTQLAKTVRRGWWKSAAKAQVARLAGLGRPVTPVLIQGLVEGRLAMYTAACVDGRLIDGVGFLAVEAHPVKGSSTILRHRPNAEMADTARRIVAALGCSGFVSFDFILDAADRAFLIEMNPRPIGSAHLGRRFGHDLVHAYLTGTPASPGAGPGPDRDVALFPKELERDPTGSRLDDDAILHDLPTHEPAVVAAYLRRLQVEHPAHRAALARRCGIAEAPQVVPKGTPKTAPVPRSHGTGTRLA